MGRPVVTSFTRPKYQTLVNKYRLRFICTCKIAQEDSKKSKLCRKLDMPTGRCVVQDCSNVANLQLGISLHNSPVNKLMRAKWVKFVKLRRKNFNPDPEGGFGVCSKHFEASCFTRPVHVPGSRRTLIPGSIPTIWKSKSDQELSAMSSRDRRMVSLHYLNKIVLSKVDLEI